MKPYELVYDAETRQHLLNGKWVPSVTEVLPEQKFFVSAERLEECRKEGEDRHDLIHAFWRTGETFGDEMLEALQRWHDDNAGLLGELILAEEPMASLQHRFCGKPDALFSRSIIDFKRQPGDSSYHELQFQGYEIMAVEAGLIKPLKSHLVAWWDGKDIKTRNVYGRNNSEVPARDAFLACVRRAHDDKLIQTYFKK